MKIAIFDFDNTLSEGYSRYELAYRLEEEGLTRPGLKQEIESLQTSYEDGQISYNDKFDQDKAIFTRYYEGLKRVELARYVKESFDLQSRIFPWAQELLTKLKEEEYLTVVVSGCWDFIIEEAQEILDFDTYLATTFEEKEGNLTGKFNQIVDHKLKDVYSTKLLESATASLGIGDSAADLVFLKKVDHGFLFEPLQDAIKLSAEDNLTLVDRKNVLEEVYKVIQ